MSYIFFKEKLILSKILLVISILMLPHVAYSRISFHVTSYSKEDYNAGNQNWSIDFDDKGNVYIGNTSGLLKLRGSLFRLFSMSLQTPVRSVRFINGKVYTGSFEEFGYWEPDASGRLLYNSLVSKLEGIDIRNEEFWRIEYHEGAIYFQSFGSLFRYENDRLYEVLLPGSMLFLIKSADRLFIQQIDGGLFEIIGGSLHLVEGSNFFADTEIKSILNLSKEKFIVGTSSKGVYQFNGSSWQPWDNQVQRLLIESKINNGLRVGDNIVFGTILNGLFILDIEGRMLTHLHSGNSLQNNTVLALASDKENNLWVGLDKGLDVINLVSPVESYSGYFFNLGAVYDAELYNDILYVGTNQGIHMFYPDENGRFTGGELLPGSQGQVWFFQLINEDLFCGHNDGTFQIKGNQMVPVSIQRGGFNLKPLSGGGKSVLLQSTYYFLVVYQLIDGNWLESHHLEGWEGPARFLEIDYLGNVWLGHALTGIFKLQPKADLKSLYNYQKIGTEHGLNSPTNRVFKLDNRIVVLTGHDILQWDPIRKVFIPFAEIIPSLQGFETSTMLLDAGGNRYWFFNRDEIGLFQVQFGKARLLYRILPRMYDLDFVEGYENIVTLNDSLHLICSVDGFSILNLARLENLPPMSSSPVIETVTYWRKPENMEAFAATEESILTFDRGSNNVRISFFEQQPGGRKGFFQYRLSGLDQNWSQWSQANEVTYYRLPKGTYTFYVRTLDNKGIMTKPSQITFQVRTPFAFSAFAFFVYALVLLIIFWQVRLKYLKRVFKKREDVLKLQKDELLRQKEQTEKELITLANEKLQSEVTLKNSQLANTAMSLVRKNELLGDIINEINKQKEELGRSVPKKFHARIIGLIEDSKKSDVEWEQFEKLFYQAHEDFFNRLKSYSNDLTKCDLRLASYLRLNLSSKEIAPLLNISVRGVEERRYRLRKRLGLLPDQSLSEFILSL